MSDLIKEKIGRNTFSRAIPREFVWTPQQIEKLLDSIMWIPNSIAKDILSDGKTLTIARRLSIF